MKNILKGTRLQDLFQHIYKIFFNIFFQDIEWDLIGLSRLFCHQNMHLTHSLNFKFTFTIVNCRSTLYTFCSLHNNELQYARNQKKSCQSNNISCVSDICTSCTFVAANYLLQKVDKEMSKKNCSYICSSESAHTMLKRKQNCEHGEKYKALITMHNK